MRKTETIEVYFPGWQLWIFSLTINLIVFAIQPWSTFAQVPIAQSDSKQAANTDTNRTALEPEILAEINRVRTNPQDYAQWLQQQRQYYDGIWLKLPGEKPVRTNKGKKALEEAIAFLQEQQPLAPLATSEQTAATASSELDNFANANNIQYFSYGRKTAKGIVMDLVVDTLFPDRRRRKSLLSSEAENTGVVCKPDPRYAKVCAIAYSDSPNSPNTSVAEAKPATPTTSTTPDSEISSLPKPEADPNSNNTDTADSNPQPTSEPTSEPETTPTAQPTENSDNAAVVTLPVPPQPQTPPAPIPTPPVSSESQANEEVEAESEADLQIAQAELEIEQEQKELAEDDSEDVEPETIEDTDDEAKLEEVAEVLKDEPEVATNLENAGIQEKIERGALESGDRIIEDDGSLYDFYPIQGSKGESFTIYLESDEFDAFVALVDSNGNTVGENDDISQSDSNSKISVTLPEDGIYNVIVNTYDEEGQGKYVLTVSR